MSFIALVAEYKARMAANEAAFQAWSVADARCQEHGIEVAGSAHAAWSSTCRAADVAQDALIAHIEAVSSVEFNDDETSVIAASIAAVAAVAELTSWRVSPQEAWTMLKKAPKIAGPWTVGGPSARAHSASFNWVMKRSDISFRLDCAGRIADDTAYAPHWASDLPGLKARIDARLREDGWILVDTEEPQHELP
jgi:hypothetical protein